MVAIIDYDAGNIMSVKKALEYMGADALITRDQDMILSADHVILPGVGAFADAMTKIREYDLENTIKEVVANKTPFLGICLGLQLIFDSSEWDLRSHRLDGIRCILQMIARCLRGLMKGNMSTLFIPIILWRMRKEMLLQRPITG